MATIEEPVAIDLKTLGDQHPKTAVSLSSLGNLLQAQQHYAAARTCFEQALAINPAALTRFSAQGGKGKSKLGHGSPLGHAFLPEVSLLREGTQRHHRAHF